MKIRCFFAFIYQTELYPKTCIFINFVTEFVTDFVTKMIQYYLFNVVKNIVDFQIEKAYDNSS